MKQTFQEWQAFKFCPKNEKDFWYFSCVYWNLMHKNISNHEYQSRYDTFRYSTFKGNVCANPIYQVILIQAVVFLDFYFQVSLTWDHFRYKYLTTQTRAKEWEEMQFSINIYMMISDNYLKKTTSSTVLF